MDTVIEPQPKSDSELRILTDWSAAGPGARSREAALGSIAVHAALVVLLMLAPAGVFESHKPLEVATQITPLVAPRIKLTQPNPGKAKITNTANMESLLPHPLVQPPQAPPSTTRPAAQTPGKPIVAPPEPVPAPPPAPPPQIAAPPKIEAATNQNPVTKEPPGQQTLSAPPPQIQPEEKPKLAFETPGAPPSRPAGPGRLAVPSSSVADAIREMSHEGSGGLTVGDTGSGPGGLGPGINRSPSPGRLATNATILSDPQGVDFTPYMLKVLAAVKRNWFAIYPESARLGSRGKVALVLSIDRSGNIPSLKISMPSGILALDRAAVAGVSASQPLPPLPSEFRGNQIMLQLVFAYNMPVN
jgi:TonB family protein